MTPPVVTQENPLTRLKQGAPATAIVISKEVLCVEAMKFEIRTTVFMFKF